MEVNSELLAGFEARDITRHLVDQALDFGLAAGVALDRGNSSEPYTLRAVDEVLESLWTWVTKAEMPSPCVSLAGGSLEAAVIAVENVAASVESSAVDILWHIFEDELAEAVFNDTELSAAVPADNCYHRACIPVVAVPLELAE